MNTWNGFIGSKNLLYTPSADLATTALLLPPSETLGAFPREKRTCRNSGFTLYRVRIFRISGEVMRSGLSVVREWIELIHIH